MKALILVAGKGIRLRPLTNNIPKCLVQLNTKTILEHEMDNFISCGISKFIIVTGAFNDQVIDFIRLKYPKINVDFVHNPKYETTNYIYSMWLTKKFIDEDIICIHGDVVLNKRLLEKMIILDHNVALINNKIKLPVKDFKAKIIDDNIKKISVDLFGKNTFFCAPLYKFSQKDFLFWIEKIGEFINSGKVTQYAEDALNLILDNVTLYPLYYQNELCMEIDTIEDLKIAKQKLIRAY